MPNPLPVKRLQKQISNRMSKLVILNNFLLFYNNKPCKNLTKTCKNYFKKYINATSNFVFKRICKNVKEILLPIH